MMTSDRARATHVEYNRSRGRARSQFVWMHITGMRRVSVGISRPSVSMDWFDSRVAAIYFDGSHLIHRFACARDDSFLYGKQLSLHSFRAEIWLTVYRAHLHGL